MTDISPVRQGARTYSAALPHPCFGPERNQARAIDWDRRDRGHSLRGPSVHQGAQPPCCNPDAVYMAATDIMPASTETPLPRGSHPYTVRGPLATASDFNDVPTSSGPVDVAPRHGHSNQWRSHGSIIDAFARVWRRPSGSDRWRREGRPSNRWLRMPHCGLVRVHRDDHRSRSRSLRRPSGLNRRHGRSDPWRDDGDRRNGRPR